MTGISTLLAITAFLELTAAGNNLAPDSQIVAAAVHEIANSVDGNKKLTSITTSVVAEDKGWRPTRSTATALSTAVIDDYVPHSPIAQGTAPIFYVAPPTAAPVYSMPVCAGGG